MAGGSSYTASLGKVVGKGHTEKMNLNQDLKNNKPSI